MVFNSMITRKTDYAIRCVLHLAESPNDIVMMHEIAERREVPKSFLAKILQTLARAGIVKSTRGVKGGFRLAKHPERITLLDIVELMEGPVSMNVCGVDRKMCSRSSTCTVHPVWVDIRRDIEGRLTEWDFAKLAGVKK